MKKTFRLFVAFVALAVSAAQTSQAAFPIRQEAAETAVVTTSEAQPEAITEVAPASTEMATAAMAETKVAKKQHFFSKMFHKVKAAASAAIPQVLYVILAILPLGWLGMGINDNWQGSDWVISLVLYILFWLPGFIFTLVKMGKYY